MITDTFENLCFYKCIIPECIEKFITSVDLQALELGRHELSDGIYVNVMEYEPKDAGRYEAHRKYADLQVVISGCEKMRAAALPDNLCEKDYNADGDYILFDECKKGFAEFEACPGVFYYFAPQDAHMPGIKAKDTKVKKAVFKIPV